jgi:hypothetical protein
MRQIPLPLPLLLLLSTANMFAWGLLGASLKRA